MHFLRGWLGSLRVSGDYFGTEQLRMHSEAVLAVVAEHEPLSSYTAESHRVYAYTKALLEGELSTCHASRRRFDRSLELGRAAGATLAAVGNEPWALGMTVQIVSNMITDLAFAEAPSGVLATFTGTALPAIIAGVAHEKESIRDLSYRCAGELTFMLNRTAEHRVAPALRELHTQLSSIARDDPHRDSRPSAVNDTINELFESNRFTDLAELLTGLRENASPDDAVVLDALDIAVKMHLGDVDEALRGVEALVAIDPYGGYLTHSLMEALSKVGREAQRISQANSNRDPRLQQVLIAVETRWTELAAVVQQN